MGGFGGVFAAGLASYSVPRCVLREQVMRPHASNVINTDAPQLIEPFALHLERLVTAIHIIEGIAALTKVIQCRVLGKPVRYKLLHPSHILIEEKVRGTRGGRENC
jgi:hypothetical protein